MLNCTESICLVSSAASASKASCKRSWSSLEALLSQLRNKPLSCEESWTETMRWQVLKTATKRNMNRLKGLLQDSKRCFAELRFETSGKPDLTLSCAVYSRSHCLTTSLLSMSWATEVLPHAVMPKRAARRESAAKACSGHALRNGPSVDRRS